MFGAPSSTSKSPFGASSSTIVFGASAPPPTFGEASSTSTGLFGSLASRGDQRSIFGKKTVSSSALSPEFSFGGITNPPINTDLNTNAPFAAIAPTTRTNTNNYVPNDKQLPYELALIDASKPSGRSTTNQQKLIQDAFESALIAHILTTENGDRPVFQFELGQFEGGVFKMTLRNEEDEAALKKLVNALPKLWSDFKPQIVPLSDLPPLQKVIFSIEGVMSKQPVKTILCMLGKQNSGLNVHQWEFENQEDKENGTKLTIGIDSDTQATLETNVSKKLYLLYGMITFELVDDKATVDKSNAVSCSQ